VSFRERRERGIRQAGVTLKVWYFVTVREMKEAIHAHEGIPVASQQLFLVGREEDDQELDDARDTAHYGILQGSCVSSSSPTTRRPRPCPPTLVLQLALL
jgi:ubiquitin C